MESDQPITPMTALVVDAHGRLTYVGEDGQRRVIIGNCELMERIKEMQDPDQGEFHSGAGI